MKKFFSKMNLVRKNFTEANQVITEAGENVSEISDLTKATDVEFSKKVGTKLRNLRNQIGKCFANLADIVTEADDMGKAIPTNFSKKSNNKIKLLNRVFADIQDGINMIEVDAKDAAEVNSSVVEPKPVVEAAVVDAGIKTKENPAEVKTVTTGTSSDEAKMFSKSNFIKAKINRIVKNYAEVAENIEYAEGLLDDTEGSLAEEAKVADTEQKEELGEVDMDLDEAKAKLDEAEGELDKAEVPTNFSRRFNSKYRKIKSMKVTNFAEAEEKLVEVEGLVNELAEAKEEVKVAESKVDEVDAELNAATEKIAELEGELEKKDVSNLPTNFSRIFKSRLNRIKSIKVTNFSEAEEKLEKLEGLTDLVVTEEANPNEPAPVVITENAGVDEVKLEEANKSFSELISKINNLSNAKKLKPNSLRLINKLKNFAEEIEVKDESSIEDKLSAIEDTIEVLENAVKEVKEVANNEEVKGLSKQLSDLHAEITDLEGKAPTNLSNISKKFRKFSEVPEGTEMSKEQLVEKIEEAKDLIDMLGKSVEGTSNEAATEAKPEETKVEEQTAPETKEEAKPEESKVEASAEAEVPANEETKEEAKPKTKDEEKLDDKEVALSNFSARPQDDVVTYNQWVKKQNKSIHNQE